MADLEFGMTWNALKLLGKNLYSHPWSAVSELVANGLDAEATEIRVHLDLSKGKDRAILEVFDNGLGMNAEGIRNYLRIGFNKRVETAGRSIDKPMGRKGIGKLAALYLSDRYFLLTRTSTRDCLMYSATVTNLAGDSKPELVREERGLETELYEEWKKLGHGTLIQVTDIDFSGFGDRAFEALDIRLAHQFLIESLGNARILLKVTKSKRVESQFTPVSKAVAFGNIQFLRSRFDGSHCQPVGLSAVCPGSPIRFDYQRKLVDARVEVAPFVRAEKQDLDLEGTLQGHPNVQYSLTGWLGLHASIRRDVARENDPDFYKSGNYNPCQIRLYVRNKLALSNLMPLLRQASQNYANYIEGELSFDVLDDDALPDIATTSRESFDVTDPRVELLIKLVEAQVAKLFADRKRLIDDLAELEYQQKQEEKARQERAKAEYYVNVAKELNNSDFPDEAKNPVLETVTRGLSSQELTVKETRKVFLSYASRTSPMADLIYRLLCEKGMLREECFYAKTLGGNDEERYTALEAQIRSSLVNEGTRVVYFTSEEFMKSEYCMFEGGAGWALRDRAGYDVLTTSFRECPTFLHGGTVHPDYVDSSGHIAPTMSVFQTVIGVTNRIIDHLNEGRRIFSMPELDYYEQPSYRTELDLEINNEKLEDLVDEKFYELFEGMAKLWNESVYPKRRNGGF